MKNLESLLEIHKHTFVSILPFIFTDNNIYSLDLSVTNSEIANLKELNTEFLSKYIEKELSKYNKKIAMGGYEEDRIIYKKSEHFGNNENARTMHLGIDIWCPANTIVSAPIDSIVHSFKNNDNFGDYGPAIILAHELEGQQFYSLYGHLAKTSIENINAGDKIKKGVSFAEVGKDNENGNWPPHLHFQLITDMMNNKGDFPGVASLKEKEKYLRICPNPLAFFYTEPVKICNK